MISTLAKSATRTGRSSPWTQAGTISTQQQVVFVLLCVFTGLVGLRRDDSLYAAEFQVSDFNNLGFSYTYGGFGQDVEATSTRLFDMNDGWGAGHRNATMDLSSLSDGRIVVDFTPNALHQTDSFKVHLNDANGLSGRWTFGTSGLEPGQPAQLTSLNTISNPDQIYDGSGFVETPPDLSNITSWAIEGLWGSPEPFDISFDNLKVSTDVAAPPPYEGFDPNAAWRSEAVTMIDQNRKADLQVQVRTASGLPVPGAQVTIDMVEHEYGFGSALSGSRVTSNSAANRAYQQKAIELFNAGTFFNDLKWPPWEGNWGSTNFSQQISMDALDWAETHGITMRGHVMVWPSYSHLPNSMKAKLDEYYDGSTSSARRTQLQSEMLQAVLDHIADIGAATEGKLIDWDVINEIRDNHELMDILGNDVMIDWFNAAEAANPSADLYLNEYLILASSGSTNSGAQQSFYDSISYLISNGAPIDGLGLQSHFFDSRLTGPEKIWEILDRFSTFGLDMKITEYTYQSDNDVWREQFTRDFLTAVFAHEATDQFVTWGSSILDAAADPSVEITPVDQAILDLVFDEWWTDLMASTDSNGVVTERVIRGLHDITVEWEGQTWTTQQLISADGLDWLVVVPDSADFDGDGDVDLDDLTHPTLGWQARYDQELSGKDFLNWQSQYGSNAISQQTAATIPEPHSIFLALAMICVMMDIRHPQREGS